MKNKCLKMNSLSLLSGMIFLLILGACSMPSDHFESVMSQANKVEKEILTLSELLRDKKLEEAQAAFLESKEQTAASLKKLERMSAFRGDDSLRQAAIELVSFYNDLFANEYQEAFDLLKKGGPYSIDEGDRMFEIMVDVSKRSVEVRQNLDREQLAFIRRYGLIQGN